MEVNREKGLMRLQKLILSSSSTIPKSKGRAEHIDKAREIILKCRKPETPVGIVKGAMRGMKG